MKHFLTVFLSLIICLSAGIIGVNATTSDDTLAQDFFEFCNSKVQAASPDDSVQIHDFTQADGMIFFHAECSWIFMHQMAIYPHSMGDWCFMTGSCENGLSGLDVYVKVNDEILTIEDAWKNGTVTDLTPVSQLDGLVFYRRGDVNGDNALNIKDATALQKLLASIKTASVSNKDIQASVFDMNNDGKVNIQDATAIQKYIAKAM